MRVDHIAVLVSDLDRSIQKYTSFFGRSYLKREIVEAQEVELALFELDNLKFELITPLKNNVKLLARLESHGEGVHHIAFESLKLEFDRDQLEQFEPSPIKPAHSDREAFFLRPSKLNQVLFEIIN